MQIQIYSGDTIQEMTVLPPQSIHCIVTSPPWYGEGNSRELSDIQSFRKAVLSGFARVLQESGIVFWDTFSLENDLTLLKDWNIIEIIQWGKSHLLCFSKNKTPLFNNTWGREWDISANETPLVFCQNCSLETYNAIFKDENGHRIIQKFCSCNKPNYLIHHATFPLKIPMRCISIGTLEGDTVLDPFCGSGTTALACIKLNRAGIMIDKDNLASIITAKRVERECKNCEKKKKS